MPKKNEYPTVRIWRIADKRADEIVNALKAQGIRNATKASLISEMLLAMPMPKVSQPTKRTRKAAPAQ